MDRQTDMTKLIVAFHNFANASKMGLKETGWKGMDWIHLAQDRDK
jgi:hypothetical protein